MNKYIVYPNDTGGVAVLIPAEDLIAALQSQIVCAYPDIKDTDAMRAIITIIAEKDVPTGMPYKIVDITEVPTDRTFRAAWEADFATPDGVGA